MEDQNNSTQPKSDAEGATTMPGRRRLAIAIALLFMGAVLIDPGLLDDSGTATQIVTPEAADAGDEFAQIERMLADSEAPESHGNATAEHTLLATSTESHSSQQAVAEETHAVSPSSVLMIPQDTGPNPAANSYPENFTTTPMPKSEDSGTAAMAVSYSPKTLEIPDSEAPQADHTNQNYSAEPPPQSTRISLVGTIDPIR